MKLLAAFLLLSLTCSGQIAYTGRVIDSMEKLLVRQRDTMSRLQDVIISLAERKQENICLDSISMKMTYKMQDVSSRLRKFYILSGDSVKTENMNRLHTLIRSYRKKYTLKPLSI